VRPIRQTPATLTLSLAGFLVAMLTPGRAARADDVPAPPGRTRADLPARLADPDTADGRLDGDLTLVVGVGATVVAGPPRAAAELRLRYLETAGLFVTYEDAFGARGAGLGRAFAAGVELRPLFLGRWVTGRDLGLTWPDLVIDSFGLEIGAVFVEPAPEGSARSPGFQASLGLELPLLSRASGPWIGIHGGGRWTDGAVMNGAGVSEAFLSLTLAWHQLFATHAVDASDVAP
jgi:hypothetical protein